MASLRRSFALGATLLLALSCSSGGEPEEENLIAPMGKEDLVRYVGIDLHKESLKVCVMYDVRNRTFTTLPTKCPNKITAFFTELAHEHQSSPN